MPSQPHELILMLFRSPSALLTWTLSGPSQVDVPPYRVERVDSADLTDVKPAEYRADLVITLVAEDGSAAMSIIVEAQLSRADRKQYVWPVYAAHLRARLECPVCVLVVTLDESVARWAAQPIELGGESRFVPLVLGPAQIAQVTDIEQACALPELAILSVMAHGRGGDVDLAVKIARAALHACATLEDDQAEFYADIVYASLSKAARQEVMAVTTGRYQHDSEFLQACFASGQETGQAVLVRWLLALRFGELAPEVKMHIASLSADEVIRIGERLLTAETLEQALGGE